MKRYESGAQAWVRRIVKPVAGTRAGRARRRRAALRLVGRCRPPASSPSTTAPAAGVLVTAGFEFDVPVRFDTDRLDVTWDLDRLGSIASIPLVEVRR